MSKKILIFLTIIVIIASILRLWRLGEVPISPDWDEVALGYNAYSIMTTARDEYGEFLPIILRSFDDYKPALYAYLTIPAITIFDLNVFSVRLPSAVFGILTVLAVFFLVKELFKKDSIALLSSFLLAISPWSIQFSRVAFESNVGVALNVFGVLFFLKSFKKPWFLLLSALMMGLGLYIYQSEKVFVPLLCIVLFFIFRKQLFLIKKKYLFIALLILTFIALPLINFTLTNKETFARAKGVSIFSDSRKIEANARRVVRDRERNDFLGLILDNRRIEFAKSILGGYLSHFDPNWLFIKGDIARHHAPGIGLLYLWEFPFLIIGVYVLLFGDFSKRIKLLIFSWFLIVPIPASVTSDVPHAVRTLSFLPIFQIFTAVGVFTVASKISHIKYQIAKVQAKYLVTSLFFLMFTFNFLYYFNQYFVQQNYFHALYWQYGYKEIVEYLMPIQNTYSKIIVSNRQPLDQSYMFFLFYSKYDPAKYLAEGGTRSGKLGENGNKFLNFEFRPFDYYEERERSILLVGTSSDFTEIFKTIKTANYPNKEVAIRVVEKD